MVWYNLLHLTSTHDAFFSWNSSGCYELNHRHEMKLTLEITKQTPLAHQTMLRGSIQLITNLTMHLLGIYFLKLKWEGWKFKRGEQKQKPEIFWIVCQYPWQKRKYRIIDAVLLKSGRILDKIFCAASCSNLPQHLLENFKDAFKLFVPPYWTSTFSRCYIYHIHVHIVWEFDSS